MGSKLKRFYQEVSVIETAEGFEIHLDGRVLRTVAKRPLVLKQKPLAELVANEWKAQKDSIQADTMPATRLANIALDRGAEIRQASIDDMMMYAETDLLSHRAKEEELRALQGKHWDGVLQFLQEKYGIRMLTTTGVVPVVQPQESLNAIRRMLGEANDLEFVALAMVTPLLGSVLLTLALWKKGISLEAALQACRVDEDYQAAKWGKDMEATALWESKAGDLRACGAWLAAIS